MRRIPYVLGALFSLAGIAVSGYLGFIHLALARGELIGGAACGAAGSILNCHAVTASSWGKLFGLPLAFWGVWGYLIALTLVIAAWRFPECEKDALAALVLLAIAFVAADAFLLYAMFFKIHFLCPLCLVTHAASLGLLISAKMAVKKSWGEIFRIPRLSAPASWFIGGILITALAAIVVLGITTNFLLKSNMKAQVKEYVSKTQSVAVETAGSPSKGAKNPKVRIVEFSDFLCPACHRAFKFNEIIMGSHRDDVSFIFKNYPLDSDCNSSVQPGAGHPGACRVAAAAACAHEQDKFWRFHDIFYAKDPKDILSELERGAEKAGLDMGRFSACMAGGSGLEAVKKDIAEAQRLKVQQTPTYLINGIYAEGIMTPATFEEFFQAIEEK